MNIAQSILIYFISPVLSLIVILIFLQVILSWLVGFGIINLRNPMMASFYHSINRFVDPVLAPFRKIIPPMGGLDLSPIAALLAIQWLNGFIVPKIYAMLG
jgi:YggT family protein